MVHSHPLLALDLGEKRIGVAIADPQVRIAVAHDTIQVNGSELEAIKAAVDHNCARTVVVGYPRNQSGEPTAQTEWVESVAAKLKEMGIDVVFQDESLTSVRAEQLLSAQKRPFSKGDVDALAASLILQDYLEQHSGRL
ncbi:MAG TPA: Holliday junction resolvase RuvX [Candidatus Saccharimonas sp.]|jgi:putative Holliday junction resolvase|nr:Holliday junction resolvase RuvX [Candidatus Saccharimonas sp.]